jgi:hypothetical protein
LVIAPGAPPHPARSPPARSAPVACSHDSPGLRCTRAQAARHVREQLSQWACKEDRRRVAGDPPPRCAVKMQSGISQGVHGARSAHEPRMRAAPRRKSSRAATHAVAGRESYGAANSAVDSGPSHLASVCLSGPLFARYEIAPRLLYRAIQKQMLSSRSSNLTRTVN